MRSVCFIALPLLFIPAASAFTQNDAAAAVDASTHAQDAVDVSTLTIGETFTIQSKTLGEDRRINVYMPAAYTASPDTRVPVLYMPDGGIAEDFLHIAGLVQVSVGNRTMRPFLLVGIENTQRRRDLTGPTQNAEDRTIAPEVGGSAAFRQFIRTELMPVIDARYRTTDETAIMGESLAGLFVVETFFVEPDLFDTYIAFDPSLWWNDNELVTRAADRLRTGSAGPRTLYLASSSEKAIEPLTHQLADLLDANAPANLAWHYEAMPDETHATTYHPAALQAVRRLFAVPDTSASQSAPSSPPQAASSSPLAPCSIPGLEEELLCGTLTVFENRVARSGRTIDLNVVVVPALDTTAMQAPLFDLAGGPGIAATGAAALYATELSAYREHSDVVLVDQRGTGESNPLHCDHATTPQYFLDEMYPVEYVMACRAALERRADLTQYTTAIAADDLDDVRAWLGYDRINLIGFSYGTRLTQVYLRRHPDRVRSAILIGVTPTNHMGPLHHAHDGQRAMDLLLDECAADADCQRAFPRIRQDLQDVLERLDRQPAHVQYTPPETNDEVSVEIRRAVFAEELRSRMYDPGNARRLPNVIHQAAMGDFDAFLELAIPADRTAPDFIADGMYLSVTCAEDTRWIDPAEAERLNRDTYLGDYRVFQQRRACDLWPPADIPEGYHSPVVSDAPVLIVSGFTDPVTPPVWGESVARHLPNSMHLVIRHHAHVLVGLSNIECLDGLMMDFLRRGSVEGLNTSCVSQMLPPPFVIGA